MLMPARSSLAPSRRALRTCAFLVLAAVPLAACGGDSPTETKVPNDSILPEPTVEARALWLSRYDYSTQAQLQALIDSAYSAHFNIIYLQVRGNADALYVPGLEPWFRSLSGGTLGQNPGWDPLQVAVQRAHSYGMELHAWCNVTTAWATSYALTESIPRHQLLVHPEWALRDTIPSSGKLLVDGTSQLFSPAADGYRTHVARVAADIVRRYAVDGIHLDYIRYPYQDWWDKVSLDAWNASGRKLAWDDFRRAAVTDIVKQVYDSIRAVRPAARLSAATWGIYQNTGFWSGVATGYEGRLQDSRGWANLGIIDALVPMVYWHITPTYRQKLDFAFLADDHAKASVNGRHTYIGLDIENDSLSTNGSQMVAEINRARFAGAQGVSVFSAQIMARNNWWHVLPQTVFKKRATVPPMAWK
ncbi:MAG TPA: family 10 glycosylhydrolase [Longimicrobiales bacterium]